MDRVFLDANVLFSAAYWPDAWFLELWNPETVELVTSAYAVAEAKRNLDTPERRKRLSDLLKKVRRASPAAATVIEVGLLQPALIAKDLEILAAAVEAKADVLLTADAKHFRPLAGKAIRGVKVEDVFSYLKRLRKSGDRVPRRPTD